MYSFVYHIYSTRLCFVPPIAADRPQTLSQSEEDARRAEDRKRKRIRGGERDAEEKAANGGKDRVVEDPYGGDAGTDAPRKKKAPKLRTAQEVDAKKAVEKAFAEI